MIATSANNQRPAKADARKTWVTKKRQRLFGGHMTMPLSHQTPTPSSATGSTYPTPLVSACPALIGRWRVMMTEYNAAIGNHAAAYHPHIRVRVLVIDVLLLYF